MKKLPTFVAPDTDMDDIGHNHVANPTFDEILAARFSRRGMLKAGVGGAAAALLGSISLTACGGDDSEPAPAPTPGGAPAPAQPQQLLQFGAVPKSLADTLSVPNGYTARVLIAVGDPLGASTPAYKNDGTDTDFELRNGEWHDGIEFFGLNTAGNAPDRTTSERGLLGMNHEWVSQQFLHANGPTAAPRPAAEVDKEIAALGVSIVEVAKGSAGFTYVKGSAFNRRITAATAIDITGPARGNALMATRYSTDATVTRGTLNNCGTGQTPWGTLVTGEENWSSFFARASGDTTRDAKSAYALGRYGITPGVVGAYQWASVAGGGDLYDRWDVSVKAGAAELDYRNAANTFGYVVEIDPYNKSSRARKRTALGRFAHESAAVSLAVEGKPLAFYMGDDSRNEYIYKYVSAAAWQGSDATAIDRLAVGDKYLDNGKLYVAKFNADGTGEWIELAISNPAIQGYGAYTFADQGDVCIHSRLAADAVGATKMDRPEWCSAHPRTGEIYFTLTNNSNRRAAPSSSSQVAVDAANPRAYTDMKGSTTQSGNVNGHIIRLAEADANPASMTFKWDIYLFGSEAGADAATINLSGLTAANDFSSPDGLWFSPKTGVCWIQTDDGAYTDVTNCMMLAALPGKIGDGGNVTLTYNVSGGTKSVTTPVGKKAAESTLKRFLVGPSGCEVTGVAETPDGKTLFINIQHPGEETAVADLATPSKYASHWPDGGSARPRSATVVITKDDGGAIGS
ncbi:PhoX family protein [Cupriavidus sp. CP313]